MQVFGGSGTNNDRFPGPAFATSQLLSLADKPDDVHVNLIGPTEFKRHPDTDPLMTGESDVVPLLSEPERWASEAGG